MYSALLVFKFLFLRVLDLLVGLHPGVSDTALLISDHREDPVLHELPPLIVESHWLEVSFA